ncbi:MAG: efflux RND transporter periplasmic adaptor subunit [Gammaproteobacteria bacterium]|nr:efflux RND transporter periplasmic adaptor subunit [Gammaproteobacteria bacterium]
MERTIKKMKHHLAHHSPISLYRVLLLLLCIAGLVSCSQESGKPKTKKPQAQLVETVLVISDNLSVVRTRTGTLRARRIVKVFTQEEGRVTALPFYEGDKINKGDILVQLDSTLLSAQLTRATATRKQAEQDVKRLKRLIVKKVASEDEYTRALTQLDVARADEDILKTRVGYTTIKSPISGVVAARFSEPGNIVNRHEHILTITDPTSLITELPVSELILPYLLKGDKAKVKIDALGNAVYEGLITRIHPGLDPVTRRGRVEVELQPVPAGAAPGQLCRIELNTHTAKRRVIPFSALRRDSKSEYVFIVNEKNEAQRVDITSGLRLAEKIEITDGLHDGQQVITKGFLGLVSGKKVKQVSSDAPK